MNAFLLLLVAFASVCPAETHRFQPRRYWREFTPYAEPALRIKPGDTVLTTTVDSEGVDEHGKRVTPGWNPLTGPFYVEGAEPGDTLAVVLERIRLNRATGVASTRISDDAVTPEYIRQQFRDQVKPRGITWTFDEERRTGRTDFSERLRDFKLPLRPFLGCLGVAPPMAEAQHSITVDAHGGNMDYNRLVEGVTVYFPVSATGAYLFMGDAHAAQGDGETSGGAIETSAEIQFRVLLHKKKTIPAVRA
jgi:acetamidase/formamidase